MPKVRSLSAILSLSLGISAVAVGEPGGHEARASRPLLTASVDPKQFGTEDYTITTLSATGFDSNCDSNFSPGFAVYSYCDGPHWYATLDLPAGVVIDYIGVNTYTTVDAAMGFTLHFRDHLGGTAPLASFSFPAHGFATDYSPGPLGILIPANIDRVFVLDVEQAPGDFGPQYFAYVEIWWRRVVSDPPATPTFGDVPSSHNLYPYIEALAKSGITAGCAGGNFCPDNPLTRGQMAVFLAKALGLHWPH
jgi:hypothetical protein